MKASAPAPPAWHHAPSADVVQQLGVDAAQALTASEVTLRQKKSGTNRVTTHRGTPRWLKFLRQFHQPLVYILLVAVGVTSFLGEWIDAAVILCVVLVNAAVGFLQDSKAEPAIAALAGMVVSQNNVRRDGRTQRVPSDALVPGVSELLQPGDRVPAHLRLLGVKGLQADESALTGESVPVLKQTDPLPPDTLLANRRNLAFAGALVTAGHGEAVVFATGHRTETGNIARPISTAEELSTPPTKKIARFSRVILWVILGLATAAFSIGVARAEQPVDMFMAAVAVAGGAIPEGLPAVAAVVLTIGVSRMAKRHAVIRRLPAVETLGGTTIICTDKTGALTENQMTVRELFAGEKKFNVTVGVYELKGELQLEGSRLDLAAHPALAECLRAGVLCNDSQITRAEGEHPKVISDPTESVMLVAAEKCGLLRNDLQKAAPRHDIIPFASEHMFRATLHSGAIGLDSWLRILGVVAVAFFLVEVETWFRHQQRRDQPAPLATA